jgi:putative nucleotidyltransferase with HDIG domain
MIAAGRFERASRAYFRVIPVIGVCILSWALLDLFLHPPSPYWFALAGLTVLTGSFTVKIPGLVARLSVSEPFVFAATLWYGPPVGAVTAALDALIMSLWLLPHLKTVHRVMLNVSFLVIAIWVASQGFFFVSGIDPRAPVYSSLSDFIVPLYLFAACSFLLNTGLIAIAISFERKQSAFQIWREQFLWLSLNYFGGASVAAVLVVYADSVDWAVVGVIVPLLAISYLTFRTTLGRLEDANTHLGEVNSLYLSTIETLAMAVDAKDQVTHGHIRRVQRYALGLAEALGVNDEKQIKAIEAAALLHDMGKLAIPEYILNKPGRLTPLEFDKMKLHAGIGADILSSIDFPYPVVPIVRHHHENWDGSGYPDGIRGTAIPLGARILSVVDCYDALTSDRPYRPALTSHDALKIVVERRGVMYDPIVVDTFAANLDRLEESARDLGSQSATLKQIAELNSPASISSLHLADETRTQQQLPTVRSWEQGLKSAIDLADLAPATYGHLVNALPIRGCAVFLVNADGATLCTASVAGDIPQTYVNGHTDFGKRICGWVAANKVTAVNSVAALDFDDPMLGTGGLQSSLVCPVVVSHEVAGVLGFYSRERDVFTREHQAVAENFARIVAKTLTLSKAPHESLASNSLAQLISKAESRASWWPIGIVVVRVHDGDSSSANFEAVLRTLRQSVRNEDSLLRLENDVSLLLLPRSNNSDTRSIASRIEEQLISMNTKVTIEWASVDRGPDADAHTFGSLADAIRHTTMDSRPRSKVTH